MRIYMETSYQERFPPIEGGYNENFERRRTEMKTSNLILFAFSLSLALIIFVLPSCEHNVVVPPEREPQNSFFPLAVGNWWEYTVTEAPLLDSTFISRLNFTTRIVDKTELNNKTYFLLQELLAKTDFPEPLLIRGDGNKIFANVQGEDLLLYNFNPKGDTLWTIPYLLRPGDFPPHWQNCIQFSSSNDSIKFHWNMCDPLEESAWDEYFIRAKGRVKIILQNDGYGRVTWKLTNFNLEGR